MYVASAIPVKIYRISSKTEKSYNISDMNNVKKLLLSLAILTLISCAELMQIAGTVAADRPLTNTEIIAGLKQALVVGTDSSVARLAKTDGYFRDQLVKILLPPEADIIVKNIVKVPGGEKLLDDVILRINRAAEDAAREAGPIFVGSITSMTLSDGLSILKGGDHAATDYLRNTTYGQLFNLYQPKIRTSLDKKLIGNISTNESWNTLTREWNKIASSVVGQIAGFSTVNVKLDEYLTGKALDGLFLKIAEEEKNIRTNPLARVTELLKRVFGTAV